MVCRPRVTPTEEPARRCTPGLGLWWTTAGYRSRRPRTRETDPRRQWALTSARRASCRESPERGGTTALGNSPCGGLSISGFGKSDSEDATASRWGCPTPQRKSPRTALLHGGPVSWLHRVFQHGDSILDRVNASQIWGFDVCLCPCSVGDHRAEEYAQSQEERGRMSA
jgi:hypothetical protein